MFETSSRRMLSQVATAGFGCLDLQAKAGTFVTHVTDEGSYFPLVFVCRGVCGDWPLV